MKTQVVYLDSNCIIAACDRHDDVLRMRLDTSAETGTHIYPFSAEQVSEVACSESVSQNAQRLDYLARISRCIYFVNSLTEFGLKRATPQSVHGTLNEVDVVPSADKVFSDLVSHQQQVRARQEFGLGPNVLNNLDPLQAVSAINDVLRERATSSGPTAPKSLAELAAVTRAQIVESFSEQWRLLGQDEGHALRSFEIVSLFSMLDFFGYWSDDAKTYAKGSRFPDSRHAFTASYFEVFVSNDKRLRNRARAVYEVLRIGTRVVSSSEFCEEGGIPAK